MSLTPAQLVTVKAAILADPALVPFTSGSTANFNGIVDAMNLDASPAFVLWRSAVTPEQWRKAITVGADQLDNLTVGKRDALLYVCAGTLDCTISSVRAMLDGLCGTQNTLKAALLAAEKRNANRVEKALATGTGSDASPATATYEGQLSLQDVVSMFNV